MISSLRLRSPLRERCSMRSLAPVSSVAARARAAHRLLVVDTVLVLSTAASVDDATRLARLLVGERLAACVNVVDRIRSVYRWKGEIQEDAEVLMLIKTTAERYQALCRRLLEEHSYETPEIVRLDLAGGDPRYLAWLVDQVSAEGSPGAPDS